MIRFRTCKQLQDSNGGWRRHMEAISWTKESLKKQRKQKKRLLCVKLWLQITMSLSFSIPQARTLELCYKEVPAIKDKNPSAWAFQSALKLLGSPGMWCMHPRHGNYHSCSQSECPDQGPQNMCSHLHFFAYRFSLEWQNLPIFERVTVRKKSNYSSENTPETFC